MTSVLRQLHASTGSTDGELSPLLSRRSLGCRRVGQLPPVAEPNIPRKPRTPATRTPATTTTTTLTRRGRSLPVTLVTARPPQLDTTVSSTPHVSSSNPHVTSSTPHVTSSTPRVTSSTPRVTSSTPHVTASTPHVTSSTPHVTSSPIQTQIRSPPPTSLVGYQLTPSRIDQRLAQFTGAQVPASSSANDTVARFDKPILQVLDEMAGSMTVFRTQISTFVETKLSESGPGNLQELKDLETFLRTLVPDVEKLLETSGTISCIPRGQLRQHYGAVSDLVSAIRAYSVHQLHYTPNLDASDLYDWLSKSDTHVRNLVTARSHFNSLMREIEAAVNRLIDQKVFV